MTCSYSALEPTLVSGSPHLWAPKQVQSGAGAISLKSPTSSNVSLLAAQSNNFRNASNAHPSPPTIADCLIGYIWNMSNGGQSLPSSFGLGSIANQDLEVSVVS
jgi:hypothetical protein